MRNRTPDGGFRLPVNALPNTSTDLKRRGFLLALSTGGAGAAASVIAAPIAAPIAVVAAQAATTSDDGSGYRETEHVRDYYRTARI